MGKDGWCINFNKATRTCSIFDDRPRFCRVEPAVFEDLYEIPEEELAIEACKYVKIIAPIPCFLRFIRGGERDGSLKYLSKELYKTTTKKTQKIARQEKKTNKKTTSVSEYPHGVNPSLASHVRKKERGRLRI